MDDSHAEKPLGAWLWQVGRLVRLYHMRAFDDIGIPGMAHMVLFPLLDSGPMRQEEIAKILGTDKSMIARSVKALMECGYITRVRDPEDGRAYLVSLTPEAEGFWKKIQGVQRAESDAMEKGFTTDEKKLLRQFLERILSNLSEFVEEALGEIPGNPCQKS